MGARPSTPLLPSILPRHCLSSEIQNEIWETIVRLGANWNLETKITQLEGTMKKDLSIVMFAFGTFCVCTPIGVKAEPPQKTISINFDSTDNFTESDDVKGTAAKSGLTAAQRASVVSKVQMEYDAAVGAGVVKVSEGDNGDVKMIVNGGRAPGVNQGKEAGDAGKSGQPGVAHEGELTNRGFAGDDLVNGIAETVAHEAGHKLGIAEHNSDNPPTKMTKGNLVTDAQRKADARAFDAHDIKKLKMNLGIKDPEQKDSFSTGDLDIFRGQSIVVSPNIPDDQFLDVNVQFTGPPGAEFGYISSSNEFVFEGDPLDNPYPGFLTFIYSTGANLAVEFDGTVSSLENGGGTYSLFNPNPDNPQVFLTADLLFNTSMGMATLVLNDTVESTTGGFVAVPEPSTAFTILLSLPVLMIAARLNHPKQRRA
jgi:hypothetical protein